MTEQRLIMAALAWYDRRGPDALAGPDRDLAAAIADYRADRDSVERARDDFLALYPTPEAMAQAVEALRARRRASRVDVYAAAPGTSMQFPAAVTAALHAEAEASVRLDGETIDVGMVTVEPDALVHDPGRGVDVTGVGRAADPNCLGGDGWR